MFHIWPSYSFLFIALPFHYLTILPELDLSSAHKICQTIVTIHVDLAFLYWV